MDPDFPSFNFDMIEKLTWSVDPSSPARSDIKGEVICPDVNRIRDPAYEGQCLPAGQRFVLATNSCRDNGSVGFAGAEPMMLDGQHASCDALCQHIAEADQIGPSGTPDGHSPRCPARRSRLTARQLPNRI